MLLADRFCRAQLDGRLAPRFAGRHARAHILLCLQGKMLGDLFLQAFACVPSSDEIGNANQETAQKLHDRPSALTSTFRFPIGMMAWFLLENNRNF